METPKNENEKKYTLTPAFHGTQDELAGSTGGNILT